MNLNDRIEKIKPYFKIFNISDGIAYVLVSFPKTWSLFNTESISNNYNIGIQTKSEGTYFLSEITNGTDGIFDAIEYIMENNKDLEEKKVLLQEKAKELSDLFASEPLEKLKMLEFTFPKKSPSKTKKNDVKRNVITTDDTLTTTCVQEPSDSHVEEIGNATCLVSDSKIVKEEKPKKNKKQNKSNDLLSYVEDLCEND